MKQFIGSHNVPIGFGMALSENFEAMQYFSSLGVSEQNRIIDRSRQIHSRNEMHQYVNHKFKV